MKQQSKMISKVATEKNSYTLKIIIFLSFLFSILVACTPKSEHFSNNNSANSSLELQFSKELRKTKSIEKKFKLLTIFNTKALNSSNEKVLFLVNFEKGNLHYSLLNIDSAKYYWDKALVYAENKHDLQNAANLNSNLGAYYLQNGYLETAIHHFLTARKIKEKLKILDENYWSIHLNIGVANMSLNQLGRALHYFNSIPTHQFKNLKFLVYLNKAKLAALKKKENLFYYNMDLAKKQLSFNSFYSNIFDEVYLEFSLDFKNTNRIKDIFKKLAPKYTDQPLYIKILLQHASILISGKTINNEVITKDFDFEVKQANNLYTSLAFNYMLTSYYKVKNNFKLQAFYLENGNRLVEKINISEAKTALNDYFLVLTKNKLSFENEQLKTANELKTLKIKNQRYLTIFLFLAILSLLILGWFIVKYYRKSQLEKEKDVTYMQLNLEQQITERQRLQKLVQNQEFKIKEILTNVSKIAILKKQMEEFVASMNELPSNGIEKDLAKQAKINTDAFFNNYIDLAILASQKDDNDFAEIKSKYQHILTENEMNVLLLILNDYTTKEIAILLSKSEKGIEYSRKNIRLKLTIPKETSINQFVLEDLM